MQACTIRVRVYFIFEHAGARQYFFYNDAIRMVDREGKKILSSSNQRSLVQRGVEERDTILLAEKNRNESCFLKSIMGAVYNRTASF